MRRPCDSARDRGGIRRHDRSKGGDREVGVRIGLQDVLELEKVEDLPDVGGHPGELQVSAVLTDFADFADEYSPAGAGDVLHAREVHHHVVTLFAEQRLETPLQIGARRGVHVAGDAQNRHPLVFGRLFDVDVDSLHSPPPCPSGARSARAAPESAWASLAIRLSVPVWATSSLFSFVLSPWRLMVA